MAFSYVKFPFCRNFGPWGGMGFGPKGVSGLFRELSGPTKKNPKFEILGPAGTDNLSVKIKDGGCQDGRYTWGFMGSALSMGDGYREPLYEKLRDPPRVRKFQNGGIQDGRYAWGLMGSALSMGDGYRDPDM